MLPEWKHPLIKWQETPPKGLQYERVSAELTPEIEKLIPRIIEKIKISINN
jgi:hypothetical protein